MLWNILLIVNLSNNQLISKSCRSIWQKIEARRCQNRKPINYIIIR